MALDTWAFVVAICLFGLGALWSAARVIAASRAKARHIKSGHVHATSGSVQLINPQTRSVVYTPTFLPADLKGLDQITALAATSLVADSTLVNNDRAKMFKNYWTWVKPFDVSIAILFGLVFSGIVGVGVSVSAFVDIGSYVRTDGIESFWLGHVAWGITLAIVTCTCLWATGSYKYPAHFQTILVVGLCAFSAGLSLALGSLATDGRQYVGFAFGAFFTVCVGVFGLYDLFIYTSQDRHPELKEYVNALRFVYGIAIIVGLVRHVVLILSPEYAGVFVFAVVASDVQFMIDSIAFAIIALAFFRARMELYRAMTALTLNTFKISPQMYSAHSHHVADHSQFYYSHHYGHAAPATFYQQPMIQTTTFTVPPQGLPTAFPVPSQGVPNAFTGSGYMNN